MYEYQIAVRIIYFILIGGEGGMYPFLSCHIYIFLFILLIESQASNSFTLFVTVTCHLMLFSPGRQCFNAHLKVRVKGLTQHSNGKKHYVTKLGKNEEYRIFFFTNNDDNGMNALYYRD